jgi:hypothetical protein
MKNPCLLSRILMLMIFSGSCLFSMAQSATSGRSSSKVYHHWHSVNPDIKLSSSAEGEYRNLPQTDYTPQQNIKEWSSAVKVQSFASDLKSKLSVLYVLSVDDAGYVRQVKTIKTNDPKNAASLSALILDSKVSGPSFTHNQAVASYVPCSISIDKHQITIL